MTNDTHIDTTAKAIQFKIDKCPIPIIWLDTSILLNLAMLKLGMLKDNTHEDCLSRLRQRIHDLTRAGKLLCPEAEQPSEVWNKRSDFLGVVHELSLGITSCPKGAIEEAQIQRLMTAYIGGARSVTFSYIDAFIDDRVPRFAETLTRNYFVTVDSTLIGTIEQIRSQRNAIHQEWEELRSRCVGQGITFDHQLQRERVGGIQATITMARDCLVKAEKAEKPTEDEIWSLASIGRLVHTWDRLGGEPKGSEGLVRFLNSPYYQIAPSCDISSNLIAQLMVGDRTIAHGDAMDTEHISSMLPYANLMILDRSMRSIVRGLGLDKKYGTTVCYIGDDEEIARFLDSVERGAPAHSRFPPFPNGRDDSKL